MASSKPKTKMQKIAFKVAVDLCFDADKQLHYGEVVVLKYKYVKCSQKSILHIKQPKGYVDHYISGVISMNEETPLVRGLNRSLFENEAKELASFLNAHIGYQIERDQRPKENHSFGSYDTKSYFDQIGY